MSIYKISADFNTVVGKTKNTVYLKLDIPCFQVGLQGAPPIYLTESETRR